MADSTRPNVLFVFSDQHRGMALGCAGNPTVRTPNIDRLAAEGRQVTNAVATDPLCGPNRACLLTGQYPLTHGVIVNDLPLSADTPSVGEAFSDAGYRTGYIGKWHLDGLPREKFTPPGSRRQGFDDFWAAYNCSHEYFDATYYRDRSEPISVDGYEPVEQTDLALEFLEQDDERPFCLFLSWGPPHASAGEYAAVPEEYRALYDRDGIDIRANAEPVLSGDADHLDPHQTIADYYAAITALDDQLGRLLTLLDQTGLADETIVVYTSDHGDMLWSQGRFHKGLPWEESINVPFVIRWPDEIPTDTQVTDPFGTVDVAPTLLSLTGVSPPEAMEGKDCSSLLRGDAALDRNAVPCLQVVRVGILERQGLPEWRGIRTERYTYARRLSGSDWLLYDTQEDPLQRCNHVFDAEYETVRTELSDELDSWLNRLDDGFLSGEEHIRQLDLVDAYNERFEALAWLDTEGKLTSAPE